ncbi:hypothetical protein PILCRDRAFT_822603 [Piloderma croceum F 1598]|uniref:Ca3427-like PBP 2 domain-containing protein n=1 Tax=Piloderma croceum (strain F 1598) TaxID=765440 RepID=A0A0C3B2R2_PILCF|nr:hypothetical protein PILCRDRAFT_822603 [Piloderma croceum F 1598]
MPFRVGYVREHFSSPLLQYAEEDAGTTFTLVECPSGTGQIISRLKNDEIDIAIALTDALISGIANGSASYKLVGSYVSSPLRWAVITGKGSEYEEIAHLKEKDLKRKTIDIGISRTGSGSQTMASVMAQEQDWLKDGIELKFHVKNDIDGLIASVNDGSTSAFMWEWFTTKPYTEKGGPDDTGTVRFIGSVLTPWPSWLIAAHPSTDRVPIDDLNKFLKTLSTYVGRFKLANNRTSTLEFIKDKFGYQAEDIKAWLDSVAYPNNCAEIPIEVIRNTFSILEGAGVVQSQEGGFDIDKFVDTRVVTLTGEK